MGRTENMIITDFLRQMCVRLENNAYLGDGDGFNSNPDEIASASELTLKHMGEYIIIIH